ncbi:MAG: immunoglobulin domain-containing protein, partial [Chitinophagaceae bacterium]
MKKIILWLLILMMGIPTLYAQTPSSRSFIVGIGLTGCGTGSHRMQSFFYDPRTNTLTNGPTCGPVLNPVFSASRSVIDYNPKDNKIYYFKRVSIGGGLYDTHVWSWAPGTCPTLASPAYKSIDTFPNSYLTVAFDRDGIGWMVNLISQPSGTYNLSMTRVDFTTGVMSAPEPIALPPGVNIYQAQGDYLITPSGSMFFGYNNKLFTINYQNFGSGLNATYIDTIALPNPNQNLIGLAYAGGDFLGSFIKTTGGYICNYSEIDMLTGGRSPVTYSGTFSSYDNTSVTSSIGTAKNLVSITPTGTPGQYDVVYDVHVTNLGNYPISSVQVIDSLNYINGLANVVSASAAMQSNPGGLLINPAYNGTTNATLLLPGQTLKNFPVAENNVVIRISARINNVIQGQIYNNSAVATGVGFSSLAIRDSSANGLNADLNLNEIADDPGENNPTPFVITIAGEYPPCPLITTLLHNQDFGSGGGLSSAIPGGGSSLYTPSVTAPLAIESYTLANNANLGYPAYWNNLSDHTGNPSGRMMLVNADVQNQIVYRSTVNNLCSNLKYSFIVWAANISNQAQKDFCNAVGGFKEPRLIFRVRDGVTGLVLTNLTSGDITNSNWQEYGMRFVLPTGYTSVILEVINEGEGGCGNDVAIDDIQFGLCDPTPVVNTSSISAGCVGSSTTMSATLSDPTIISGTIEYQWQSSTDNITFNNISGANAINYTIPSVTLADAIYYRVIVASAGNINNTNCRYVSASFLLTMKTASLAPVSMLSTAVITCANDVVTLSVNGGSLGTNANWVWYRDACGGVSIGTGSSLVVNPADTTTYFVRAEGDCNNTTCVSLTINAANCI